jgi:hypothetical protein
MPKAKGSFIIAGFRVIEAEYGKEKLDEIINSLCPESKKEIGGSVVSIGYYSCDAYNEFLQKRNDIIFGGDMNAAFQYAVKIGYEHFSKGIYRVFSKFGSPSFVVKTVTKQFDRFYQGIEAVIVQLENNMTVARHQGMKASYRYLENGIMGYCVGILKASGAKDIGCRQIVSCSEGKGYSQLEYTWK